MAIQRMITGECLTEMASFPDNFFDVIITSPPYNIGIEYGEYKDKLSRNDYLNWLKKVFSEINRILSPDGSFFLNIGHNNSDPWLANDAICTCKTLFFLQNQIIWIKSIAIGDVTTGHFKPLNSPRYLNNNFEYVFQFTKSGEVALDRLALGVPYVDKKNSNRFASSLDLHCRGNVWFMPYDTLVREPISGLDDKNISCGAWITVTDAAKQCGVNKCIITKAVEFKNLLSNELQGKERRIWSTDLNRWLENRKKPKNPKHPAIFPIALPKNAMKLHGLNKIKNVLDPFAGYGTTLLACKELKVNGTGIEINPEYANAAQNRLNCNI